MKKFNPNNFLSDLQIALNETYIRTNNANSSINSLSQLFQ